MTTAATRARSGVQNTGGGYFRPGHDGRGSVSSLVSGRTTRRSWPILRRKSIAPQRSTTNSYATHAARVAVDAETGLVEILDYVIVEDCGRMVNPMIVEGQAYGGAAQGVGTGLFEECPYDGSAQPLASTLMDYLLPGPLELPNFRVWHRQTPSPHSAYGIKGVGEGGAIAPAAALVNAINDALVPLGAVVRDIPASPQRILTAIRAAEARRAV